MQELAEMPAASSVPRLRQRARDVPVDTMSKAVDDNQHSDKGEESRGLEAGICGEGFGAQGLLLRVALKFNGGPAAAYA